jgi:hypothetical protein
MSKGSPRTGPDRDTIIRLIRETWPDAAVATVEGAAFFSLLAEAHDRLAAVRGRQRRAAAGDGG